MSRSTARAPRALRPAAVTDAKTRPYARAASPSKGNGSNVASARWRRSCRRARSSGSAVAYGPAASSAMVITLTAASTGSRAGSSVSRSMITEVSRMPRWGRSSATRRWVLVRTGVEVRAESLVVDARRGPEQGDGGLRGDEAMTSERAELAHGDAVARDDERLPCVESAHDLPAGIAEFSLRDLPGHPGHRSTRCYDGLETRVVGWLPGLPALTRRRRRRSVGEGRTGGGGARRQGGSLRAALGRPIAQPVVVPSGGGFGA